MVESMKEDGESDDKIRQAILEMKIKSLENYGNRSKVGLEIQNQNKEILGQHNEQTLNEFVNRKKNTRNASDFNMQQIRANELNRSLRNQFMLRGGNKEYPSSQIREDISNHESVGGSSSWSTTNREFFSPKNLSNINLQR